MADIQYLNYGDLQIELLALLNNLANQVQDYVNNQSWSKKRKDLFMSAYSDLMNRGLRGASNTTGLWMLDVGGGPIPFDGMSKKAKEMYEEAAYFIQQLMAGLPTKSSTEELQKKDLQPFNNDVFKKGFLTQISNDYFGGNKDISISQWNEYDKRGENGLRPRTRRAEMLISSLEKYALELELNKDKYDFENSPFKSLDEFKARIARAKEALINTPDNTDDDFEALNALGLNASDWFNNGSGDPYKTTGYEGTYGGYYNEYLPAQLKLKIEEERKRKLLALQDFNNNRLYFLTHSSKLFGKDLNYLAEKYLSETNLVPKLQEYISKGLGNLNGEELSELVGAFKYGARDQISDEELKAFKAYSPLFKNAAKNQFRKFRGIEGAFYYVPTGKVYTYGGKDSLGILSQQNTEDILKGRSTAAKLDAYLNSTEFNDADVAELIGIGSDIASIIDPEPWSAGALGLLAAGARNYAGLLLPGKWGLSDYGWQAFDYLTGVAGAIPVLGDSALAYKAVKSIAKIGRKVLMIPALYEMVTETPGAYEAFKKAIDGKDLTVQDYKNIGLFIRGFTATRNFTVQNRAGRRALQKRGIETTNKWHLKLGLTETKPLSETTLPTIRIKIKDGEVQNIPITAETKTKLEKELKGKNVEERAKIIKDSEDVKKFVKDKNIKPEDIEIILDNSILNSLTNARIFKKGLPSYMQTTKGVFGETPVSTVRKPDVFDSYVGPAPKTYLDKFKITGNRSIWDRYWYGSNSTLRGMDRLNGFGKKPIISESEKKQKSNTEETKLLPNNIKETKLLPAPSKTIESKRLDELNRTKVGQRSNSTYSIRQNQLEVNNMLDSYGISKDRNIYFGASSKRPIIEQTKGGYDPNRSLENGSYNIKADGANIIFDKLSGKIIVKFNDTKKEFKNLVSARQYLARQLSTLAKSDISKTASVLRELKSKGILKQGGRIDKLKIQKYKDFINK